MSDLTNLWNERQREFWKMASRYLRLLANGAFGFYILLLLGGFYYQRSVQMIPDDFPVKWIIYFLMLIIVSAGSIRTFVKRADLVFLLPAEDCLSNYFHRAKIYSFVMQSVMIVFIWAILFPLWQATVGTSSANYVWIGALIILIKGWNVASSWFDYYTDERWRPVTLRIAFNAVALFFVMNGASFLFLVVMGVLALAFYQWYFRPCRRNHVLLWEKLMIDEEKSRQRFLKFATLIADVPEMSTQIKERKWLTELVKTMPYFQKGLYPKLYLFTFIRANDYFQLYIRLTIIGGLALLWVPDGMGIFIVGVVFLYASGVQLLTLKKHSFPQAMEGLYPVLKQHKEAGFVRVHITLLFIQATLFGIVTIFSGLDLKMLVGAVLLFFLFALGYSYLSFKREK